MSERQILRRLTEVLLLSAWFTIGLAQETDRDAARAAEIAELEPAVDVSAVPRAAERTAPSAVELESAVDVSAEPRAADLEPAVDFSAAPRAAERAVPRTPAAPGTPGVVDRLDLGTTSITGNQELPKVLYIVPWKRSDLGNLVGRPVNTLLDEVLAPVDPEVFERHLDYYDALYGAREQE